MNHETNTITITRTYGEAAARRQDEVVRPDARRFPRPAVALRLIGWSEATFTVPVDRLHGLELAA